MPDPNLWKSIRSGLEFIRGGFPLRRIQIPCDRLTGVSVFFFSDLHLRRQRVYSLPYPVLSWSRTDEIQERLRKVLAAYPADVIVSGGDLISEPGMAEEAFGLLKNLPDARLKIAVRGNWDDLKFPEVPRQKWLDGYREAGFRFLCNETLQWNGINFYGTDDRKKGVPAYTPAEDDTDYRILLSHNPDVVADLDTDADLTLCGHTHGGQWRIPFFGAVVTSSAYGKRFEGGVYHRIRRGRTQCLVVSAGIGTTLVPLRLFCSPEVCRVEFISGGQL